MATSKIELPHRSKITHYYLKRDLTMNAGWNDITFNVDSSLYLEACTFIVSCYRGPAARLSLPMINYNTSNHQVTASVYNFDGTSVGCHFLLEVIEYDR